MTRRSLTALAVVASMATLAACGSSHPANRLAHGGAGTPTPAPTSAAPGTARSSGSPAKPSAAATGAPGTHSGTGSDGKSSAPAPTASPSHDWTATEAEIPIDATLTPTCVNPGATIRLDVVTNPKAAVGYVAVYAGEKSGAAPPFGEGYGGNDKGTADFRGQWTSSWTVALNTPPGKAYVLLVVAHSGKQRQIKVPFAVAKGVGGCGA
jgi:hypothetical protein